MEYFKHENTDHPHVFGSSYIKVIEKFFTTSNIVGVVLAAEGQPSPVAQDLFFYQFMSTEFKEWLVPFLGKYQLKLIIGKRFSDYADSRAYHFCVCFREETDAIQFKLRWI